MKATAHTAVVCSFRVKCNFRSRLPALLDASKQKLRLSLGPDVSEASSNFQPPPCTCSSLKGPNNSVLSPAVDIRVSSHLTISKMNFFFHCRIDAREKPVTKAHHSSDSGVFGPRAFFRTSFPSPAVLVIDDIKRHDAATYRCRVDFRKGQTRSFRYNLTVIVPPEQPTILDRWGRILNGTAGPYEEGDTPYLTCRVTGGKPQPMVRWLINGRVKDEEYENNAGDVIENRLTLQPISRSDLGSNFTCEARNTDLVDSKEASISLDLNLKPLSVIIRRPGRKGIGNESLLAGKRYDMECETTGSRPPAVITWYKGRRRQLKHTTEERSENRTVSTVEFEPGVEDHGKSITCRAENPNVTGLFVEKSWKIDVVYPPIVSLNLGSTLSPEDIKEGDDVYFECHIRANPPWSKLVWIHDNQILAHNTSARIIWSNQSLVLQSVTRSSAGRYVCAATNALNETRSEPLHFRVKFAPVCKEDRIIVVGASRGESLDIACRVEADPPAHNFRWKFNNSGETLEVAPGRFSMEKSSGVSVLRYTPSTELDYGTLSCWADNLVGTQSRPCLFQLVAAGKPFPVRNCTLANQTYTSVEVKCVPGYDGGLPQKFVLEVYHGDVDYLANSQPLYNVSNPDEPSFALAGLEASVEAGVHVAVYAVNAKGRSQPVILSEVTYRDAEKRTATSRDLVEIESYQIKGTIDVDATVDDRKPEAILPFLAPSGMIAYYGWDAQDLWLCLATGPRPFISTMQAGPRANPLRKAGLRW
ncbi:KIRR1 protein, partial [Acromyrmex insinuator]